MSVREDIVAYIADLSQDPDFDQSRNLFESGVLTSLDVLSIVSFIEDRYGLAVTGDDIDMTSFGTIDGLVTLISTLHRHQTPAPVCVDRATGT